MIRLESNHEAKKRKALLDYQVILYLMKKYMLTLFYEYVILVFSLPHRKKGKEQKEKVQRKKGEIFVFLCSIIICHFYLYVYFSLVLCLIIYMCYFSWALWILSVISTWSDFSLSFSSTCWSWGWACGPQGRRVMSRGSARR